MIRLCLFALVALVQLAVPAWMVREAERTLSDGEVLRVRTAPIDPADLFRGRYVRLDFGFQRAKASDDTPYKYGRTMYAVFAEDAEGFSHATALWGSPPDKGNYMNVRVRGYDPETKQFDLELPVDRLYMREDLAPLAEREYARLRDRVAWAELRLRKGHALIQQVYIDGVPLAEIARQAGSTPE